MDLDPTLEILILSTVPNLNKEIKPLKCLLRRLIIYSRVEDFKNRNLSNYFSKIQIFLETPNLKFCFTILMINFVRDYCYAYNSELDILSHRDTTHLTAEGSISLKNFQSFLEIILSKSY